MELMELLVEIKAAFKHLPKVSDLASLRADLADIESRLSRVPTVLQLTSVLIATWCAGAITVITALRFAEP